jgi:hypothetical protein
LRDWNALLRIAFAGKNKTLRALLTGNKTVLGRLSALRVTPPGTAVADSPPQEALSATRSDVINVLDSLSASSWRPNAIPLSDFIRLYEALRDARFRFVFDHESLVDVKSARLAGPGAWEHDGRVTPQNADAAIEATTRRALRETLALPLAVPGGRDERKLLDAGPRSARRGSWFTRDTRSDDGSPRAAGGGPHVDGGVHRAAAGSASISLQETKRAAVAERRQRLLALAKEVED